MDDLIAFLEARLTEDETQARDLIESEAAAADWNESSSGVLVTGPPTYDDTWNGTHPLGDSRLTRFIARHDPARALREVEAKRARLALMIDAVEEMDRLIADDDTSRSDQAMAIGRARAATVAVKHDAAIWNDHPDYRLETWKP